MYDWGTKNSRESFATNRDREEQTEAKTKFKEQLRKQERRKIKEGEHQEKIHLWK